jgi:hypothetical protein
LLNYEFRSEHRNKSGPREDDPRKLLTLKPEEELRNQYEELEFKCAMCSFSIIRFVSDHMMDLNPTITH